MTVRFALTILLIAASLALGCVRRTVVNDFGLMGRTARPAAPSPNASLRAVFQEQRIGAFNPLVDDVRIQSVRNRLESNPGDVAARLELAGLYEGYRLYEDALAQYTEAFSIAGSEGAVLGIVRCDRALNRPWDAIQPLQQFLKTTPTSGGWNALGLLYDLSGDLAAGENALREAVAAEPLSDQWRNDLGFNLMLQNKTDAAEGEFRQALELNPKSARTHNNLGMLLARRGDLGGALEAFRFGGDAATAHNNLAVVLMEMGQYEQSREELVKALAMRRYFAPALSNFKLVQNRIRERAEQQKTGGLPPGKVRVASGPPAAVD